MDMINVETVFNEYAWKNLHGSGNIYTWLDTVYYRLALIQLR